MAPMLGVPKWFQQTEPVGVKTRLPAVEPSSAPAPLPIPMYRWVQYEDEMAPGYIIGDPGPPVVNADGDPMVPMLPKLVDKGYTIREAVGWPDPVSVGYTVDINFMEPPFAEYNNYGDVYHWTSIVNHLNRAADANGGVVELSSPEAADPTSGMPPTPALWDAFTEMAARAYNFQSAEERDAAINEEISKRELRRFYTVRNMSADKDSYDQYEAEQNPPPETLEAFQTPEPPTRQSTRTSQMPTPRNLKREDSARYSNWSEGYADDMPKPGGPASPRSPMFDDDDGSSQASRDSFSTQRSDVLPQARRRSSALFSPEEFQQMMAKQQQPRKPSPPPGPPPPAEELESVSDDDDEDDDDEQSAASSELEKRLLAALSGPRNPGPSAPRSPSSPGTAPTTPETVTKAQRYANAEQMIDTMIREMQRTGGRAFTPQELVAQMEKVLFDNMVGDDLAISLRKRVDSAIQQFYADVKKEQAAAAAKAVQPPKMAGDPDMLLTATEWRNLNVTITGPDTATSPQYPGKLLRFERVRRNFKVWIVAKF